MTLAMGTIDQPAPDEEAHAFFNGLGAEIAAKDLSTAAVKLQELTTKQCTVALRDYFPGWAASGNKAYGGKPLMVDEVREESRLDRLR